MYRGLGFLILAAIALAVILAVATWRNRRQIVLAADRAAVATLASGVQLSRKVSGKAGAYRQRVIAKADERESRTPN